MVRLVTHNLLCSNVPGVKVVYPLRIRVDEVEHNDAAFDEAATLKMIPRLDYGALLSACEAVNYTGLPKVPPLAPEADETFLRALHHALFNIEIVSGAFICPESGREFPIVGGIPNMILFEDEV